MGRLVQRRKNKLHPKRKLNFSWLRKLSRYMFFLILLGVIALIVFSIPRFIKITQVNCKSQYGPCSVGLNEKLLQLQNNNYQYVRSQLIHILGQDFMVEKYEFKLNLPNTMEVYAVERKPEVAITKQSDPNNFALLDNKGVILSTTDKTSLPVLLIKQDINYKTGDILPESVIFGVGVLKQISNLYNIKLAILEPNGIVFELSEGKKVIFPLNGDLDELFGALTLILSRLNSIPQASTIDLRFKNPVLN